MFTPRYTQCYRPIELQLASAGLLGNRASFELDRTNPIELINLNVDITCGSTGPTFASTTTPAICDNIMNIVKRVEILVTEGADNNQRPIVQCSGIGLLEFAMRNGMQISRPTLQALALSQGASLANNLKIRISYPIYLAHPGVGEPLRQYSLLPVHTHPSNPVVNIDFANTADFASSGTISGIVAHLEIVRRVMSSAQTQQIIGKGGFLRQSITEQFFQLPLGTSGEQRLRLSLSGQYSGLVFRQYLGGSTMARAVVDETTTFGQETTWQIQQGTTPLHEFRWHDLQQFADTVSVVTGQPFNVFAAATSAGSPTTAVAIAPQFEGGALVSTSNYTQPASTCLNFLGDGIEQAMELGGLLDADAPIKAGQELVLFGRIASVASNASVIGVVGHRFYGDLSSHQTAA